MDLLLGRRTYEIFAAYWPYEEGPIADRLNSARKYVAWRTLEEPRLGQLDLARRRRRDGGGRAEAKDGPELQVYGSFEPLQTLLCTGWSTSSDLDRSGRARAGQAAVRRRHRHRPRAGRLERLDQRRDHGHLQRPREVLTGSFALEEPSERELARREAMKAEESLTGGRVDR